MHEFYSSSLNRLSAWRTMSAVEQCNFSSCPVQFVVAHSLVARFDGSCVSLPVLVQIQCKLCRHISFYKVRPMTESRAIAMLDHAIGSAFRPAWSNDDRHPQIVADGVASRSDRSDRLHFSFYLFESLIYHSDQRYGPTRAHGEPLVEEKFHKLMLLTDFMKNHLCAKLKFHRSFSPCKKSIFDPPSWHSKTKRGEENSRDPGWIWLTHFPRNQTTSVNCCLIVIPVCKQQHVYTLKKQKKKSSLRSRLCIAEIFISNFKGHRFLLRQDPPWGNSSYIWS